MAYDAIIVGGGISGLTVAYRLHQAGKSVLLLEADETVGGVIRTLHFETQYGVVPLEAGPNTVPTSAVEFLALVNELGIEPIRSSPLAKKRYLYWHRKLRTVFGGPFSFLMSDLLSPFGKLALFKDFFAPVCSKAEITLGDFVRHRFGGEILERILTPAVTGIYAADPDAMSLQATFPFLSEWEINSGSVIRGALAARKRKKKNQPGGKKESYALLSFQGGLGELPQAIHRALGPGVVRCGMPVQQLKKLENGLFQVKTATGVFESEALVMATPADVTKMLLLPTQPSISRRLSEITYAPMNLVYLAFEKSKLRKPWKGFGFLVPRNQKVKLLGAIWNNSLFPERYPEALSVGTYFQGGAFHSELSDIPDEALIDITVAELRKIHQEKDLTPVLATVCRWKRAIPQYKLRHREHITQADQLLQERMPGCYLTGNYCYGVSLNDCVKQANAVAEDVLEFLD